MLGEVNTKRPLHGIGHVGEDFWRRFGRRPPRRRDAHPGRGRFSGQTRVGRYSWARYYHPGLQRFISEDPIGLEAGDVNFYAYVGNNPLNFVDPLGMDKCQQCWPDCYTNCLNTLAPGFTAFFVGSQLIGNAPYTIETGVRYPGQQIIFRETESFQFRALRMMSPRAGRAVMAASRVTRTVQPIVFSWVAGVSYGCMFSCSLNRCNY
jgi:RHS repeat-associated protein